jgi:IS5 family transposase
MSKGKARTPYEFGSKVGIATTLRGNLIVGARAFDGNPYDGHTLAEQIEQATILMQDTGMKPGTRVRQIFA